MPVKPTSVNSSYTTAWCQLALIVAAAAAPLAAQAATHTVGAGQEFPAPALINWSRIAAGDTIVVYPGNYSAMGTGNSLTVPNVRGTAALPIVIKAYSPNARPVLLEGINIANNSQHVVVQDLDVTRPPSTQLAAVVVQSGSSDIVLSNLKIHGAFVGVNLTQAGLRNRLQSSEIFKNVHNGISVGQASSVADANNMSYISGNAVHNNGEHGMEIGGSYWRIEKNTVTSNGLSVPGTSGIHLFSYSDSAGLDCDHNQIYYNYVSGQKDTQAADGNGIQSDNFCDANTIAFNVVWNNDGAGISQLDGSGNTILANTSYNNARDRNRIQLGADRGEIILGSWSNICSNPYVDPKSCHIAAGRSSGNIIYDNIVYDDQADVPGINALADYVDPARNQNHLYPNMYYNAANGVDLKWGSTAYSTATAIDQVTGLAAQGGGNLVELPLFANTALPGSGSNGLRLTKQPTKQGWMIQPATPDMLGAMPAVGVSYLGAYYTKP